MVKVTNINDVRNCTLSLKLRDYEDPKSTIAYLRCTCTQVALSTLSFQLIYKIAILSIILIQVEIYKRFFGLDQIDIYLNVVTVHFVDKYSNILSIAMNTVIPKI